MNTPARVVHDTNVVVSLAVFAKQQSWLWRLWQSGRVVPLASQQTTDELKRVLAYPKFALEPADQKELLMEYLLHCEALEVPRAPATPSVRDIDDRPFLELAIVGQADALVTGDRHLLEVAPRFSIPILTLRRFRERLRDAEDGPTRR